MQSIVQLTDDTVWHEFFQFPDNNFSNWLLHQDFKGCSFWIMHFANRHDNPFLVKLFWWFSSVEWWTFPIVIENPLFIAYDNSTLLCKRSAEWTWYRRFAWFSFNYCNILLSFLGYPTDSNVEQLLNGQHWPILPPLEVFKVYTRQWFLKSLVSIAGKRARSSMSSKHSFSSRIFETNKLRVKFFFNNNSFRNFSTSSKFIKQNSGNLIFFY